MKKIIIANWKMAPASLKEAVSFLAKIGEYLKRNKSGSEIVIAPPYVYLESLISASAAAKGYGGLRFASQNVFWEEKGAFTGEISPKMLKNLGANYAIIGHSERRKYAAETDEMINKKVIAALNEGLKAVLCVGEPLEVRKKGKKAAMNFVKNQLQKDLKGIKKLSIVGRGLLVIAYEPVWSISTSGTGLVCSPDDALEMIKYIKKLLTTNYQLLTPRVLYGGSVDSQNIQGFLKHNEIDGALVGGASINAKEFKKIVELTI